MAITSNIGVSPLDTRHLAELCKKANIRVKDCKLHVEEESYGFMRNHNEPYGDIRAITYVTPTLSLAQFVDMIRAYYRYTGIRSRFHKEIQELELMAVMHGVIETDF